MEPALVLLGLAAAGYFLVMPLAAFLRAGSVRRILDGDLARRKQELEELRGELRRLRERMLQLERAREAVPAAQQPLPSAADLALAPLAVAPLDAASAAAPLDAARAAALDPARAAPTGATRAAPLDAASAPLDAARAAVDPASAAPLDAAGLAASAATTAAAGLASNDGLAPQAASAAAASAAAPSAAAASAAALGANAAAPSDPQSLAAALAASEAARAAPVVEALRADSLEEKIALVWLTRAGAVAMLAGVAYFFKYAIDNDWVGPLGRVALGALAGAATLIAAELIRPRARAIYVHVLSGVGLAILYLSAYASHAFYGLVPAGGAFAATAVITLLGGALAIRHRAEPVLVLTIIAGCAAPVLLSTGEDRPAALFAYLFILGGGGLAVSVLQDFRVASWFSIAGPAILFAGWYGKFFETGAGQPYQSLGARAPAIVAVAAFSAQWLAVWWVARGRRTLQPVAIAVAAFLLAHAGLTGLLFDHPALLGAILSGVAVGATLVFRFERRTELLALPLAASFIALYGISHAQHMESPGLLLALFGVWGGIYAAAFLREQALRPARTAASGDGLLWLACAALAGFALLAWALLGESKLTEFALVLALLSVLYAAIAAIFRIAAIALLAAVASLAALVALEPSGESPALLGIAALWCVAYFAPTAWELLTRRAPATAPRLFTLSAAGLGFVLLALRQTSGEESLIRALVLAAVGAADLLVGAKLLSLAPLEPPEPSAPAAAAQPAPAAAAQPAPAAAQPAHAPPPHARPLFSPAELNRRAGTLLLGEALGLFAAALAQILSGASITLVWAGMAAVVAALAAREEARSAAGEKGAGKGDELWLAGSIALFAAALVRLVAYDLPFPDQQRGLWFLSEGVHGALRQTVLFNQRALAVLGTGAALLVAARSSLASRNARFALAALGFIIAGHLLVLYVAVTETQNLLLHTPSPSGADFMQTFQLAVERAAQQQSMIVTLVSGVYATLLVALGFTLREKTHRWLGLGLFGLVLMKLFLWDVWKLPRIQQTFVLLALGALLLSASFLYARFGKRLVSLLRDGAGPALLLLLLARPAHAFDATQFQHVREVQGVQAAGLYRVEVDPALYRAARPGLPDVRIAAPDGSEAPWLLRDIPVAQPAEHHPAMLVDPVVLPDQSARAVFDLGKPGLRHSEVRLQIQGDEFIRRARIEVSADEREWARIGREVLLYAAGRTRETTLAYPASDARYLRVTILPGADGHALTITGGDVAWAGEQTKAPLRRLSPQLTVEPPAGKVSSLMLDLGAPGVPVEHLGFEIRTATFERRAAVEGAERLPFWTNIGGGVLYRAGGAEQLSVETGGDGRRYFRVRVQNGDDPPLDVTAAWADYRAQELVFRASAPDVYKLYSGASIDGPAYDLPAVLARGGEGAIAQATFGPLGPNDAHAAIPEKPAPFTERHGAALTALLVAVVAALGLWTLRLLRAPKA